MEFDTFLEIRNVCCLQDPKITEGKMMSSPAIHFRGKVFAFFSRKKKMVFKLGKDFDPEVMDIEIRVFNPFKNRAPLNGWFEVSYIFKEHWPTLSEKALIHLKNEL